jgi:hypothetical protein
LYDVVKDVIAGYHQGQPISQAVIPRIYVEAISKQENFASIGLTAHRTSEVKFNIYGIVQTGLGQIAGRPISDDQMIKLGDNIELIIRNYPQLSNTSYVLQTLCDSTEYDIQESNGTYNSVVRVGLTVETLTT